MLLSNSFTLLLLWNASEGVIFPSHFWEPEILRRERWRTRTRFAELGADWLIIWIAGRWLVGAEFQMNADRRERKLLWFDKCATIRFYLSADSEWIDLNKTEKNS